MAGTANGTMQRPLDLSMNHEPVFWDLLDKGVLVYLDDIFLYSRTEEDHMELLQEVFRRLEKYKLFLKATKCNLFLQRVAFFGHIVTTDGLQVEPSKILQ